MPSLTIDGRRTEAPAGTTILAAAEALGIHIPTLCLVRGLRPLNSCFVCVVQVAGFKSLVPACATVVRDGMEVVTDSPEVAAARKMAVELLLSDHLGECAAPCQVSCPASFRVPEFMDELMHGQTAAAARIACEDLVFPATLGRICPRFCENVCRRAERDQPLAIAELHGLAGRRTLDAGHAAKTCGKKVAIVGAGPTGLSAAFNLLRRGHACTIFEATDAPGGQLRQSLDEVRVPKADLAAECNAVARMGAEFRFNTALGRDVTLAQLREQFDAVLLAVGADRWQRLTCPGAELADDAGEWMRRVAADSFSRETSASSVEPPLASAAVCGHVVVVGAGHEAVEVARTSRRRGADRVTVLCARPVAALPLLTRQIAAARDDGVAFEFETDVVRLASAAGVMVDARRKTGEEFRVACDRVFAATGRDVDLAMLSAEGVTVGRRGVAVDRHTLATNLPGVFAGGDAASGGGFLVRAVAYGQLAAEAIDDYLRSADGAAARKARAFMVRYGRLSDAELALLLGRTDNPGPRCAEVGEDESSARAEAARCLMCGCRGAEVCRLKQVAGELDADPTRFRGERREMARDESHPAVVYESGKCIMCGACVAVCEQARGRGLGLTYIGRGFNVRIGAPMNAAMAEALDELAVRCAEVCPTSAIVLKRRAEECSRDDG